MKIIQTEQIGHILLSTINRPEARNAVNFQLIEELETIINRAQTDESIRVFILTGSDDIFLSGGDLKEFHTIKTREKAREMAQRMQSILVKLEHLPCWTVAAVNGAAYGGGCEIMLAFDFRVAVESAFFAFTQGKFFLPPGWGGLTRLVERVGRSTALRWLAERAKVDTKTALFHTLIDKTTPEDSLIPETMEWAQQLTLNGREYIGTLKETSFRFSKVRLETLAAEIEPFTKFWVDDRHFQRVDDFITKKDP